MATKLNCPFCSVSIVLKDDYAGQDVRCPECRLVVPAAYVKKSLNDKNDAPTEVEYSQDHQNRVSLTQWLIPLAALASILAGLTVLILMMQARKREQLAVAEQAAKQAEQARNTPPPIQRVVDNRPNQTPSTRTIDLPETRKSEPSKPEKKAPIETPKAPGPLAKPKPEPVDIYQEPFTIKEPVMEKALEILKKHAETANTFAVKDLPEMTALLPRLKKGVVIRGRRDILVPNSKDLPINYPSEEIKQQKIQECETRIAKAEATIKAYQYQDWDYFAQPMQQLGLVGECGHLPTKSFVTKQIINNHTALIQIEFGKNRLGEPHYEYAIFSNTYTGRFVVNLETKYTDILVIATTVKDRNRDYHVLVPIKTGR